jgi:hypothetical protein
MAIEAALQGVADCKFLAIPKSEFRPAVVKQSFGESIIQSNLHWIVKCAHLLNPPASTSDIQEAEGRLSVSLPDELRELLRFANGAKLFVAPRSGDWAGTEHVRYDIFGTERLAAINDQLFDGFRSCLRDDPDFKDINRLNYLAFCDVDDGNFLALLLEGPARSKVFFLDREYLGRPYGDAASDAYYTVSDSLESWLKLLADTAGWAGRGAMHGGL